MRHALAFVILVAAGCGNSEPSSPKLERRGTIDYFPTRFDGAPSGCSPATCVGCCVGGSCVTSPSLAACGFGGAACQVCKSTQSCVNGACTDQKTCTNCASGCCDDKGVCQPGTADTACGTGGNACKACNAGSEACSQGSCQAGGATSYAILLSTCQVNNAGCGAFESLCDPYVILAVGNQTKESTHQSNTNSPDWNNELMMTVAKTDLLNSGMAVTVKDEDVTYDGTISTCTIKVTAADLAAGKIVSTCGAYVTGLTFKFQPK